MDARVTKEVANILESDVKPVLWGLGKPGAWTAGGAGTQLARAYTRAGEPEDRLEAVESLNILIHCKGSVNIFRCMGKTPKAAWLS